MKCAVCPAIFVFVGCKNFQTVPDGRDTPVILAENSAPLDSVAAVAIVEAFFKAFDARDTHTIDSLLSPSTLIVHHNGATTNTAQMNKVIEETTNWWPRTRKLSDFVFRSDAGLSVLALKNEVTFELPDHKIVYEPYLETWIFERKDRVWKPVRIHYSKITVDKHSEEVQ